MGSIKMIAMARLLGGGGGGHGKFTIVPFSTGTDEEIAALIDAARAGKVDLQTEAEWAVGDTRTISIGAFTDGANISHAAQDIDIVITSFDEYMESGNLFQFDFKDTLATTTRMNNSGTNLGGYGESVMKKTTLPALVAALPEWLSSRLVDFSVLASAGEKSTTINTVTHNKLALRSEVEVFGTNNYAAPGEGTQLTYYTVQANRQKKQGNTGSVVNEYWLRSPAKGYSSDFVNYFYNQPSASGASNLKVFAPFGCL